METPNDMVMVSNEELSAEHEEPARHDTVPSTTQPMDAVMIAQSDNWNPHKSEPSTTGVLAHEISRDVSPSDKMTQSKTLEQSMAQHAIPPTGCESEQDKKLHVHGANIKSDSWTMAGKHNVLVCLDGCALGLKVLIR